MIKLESKNLMPSSVAVLTIQSAGDVAGVSLSTEEVREQDAQSQQWSVSKTKRKQIITFIGSDGQPCSVEGTVYENEAIEIPGAYKILVEVRVSVELKAAYQAGRVSKAYTSLEVVRVVEVWADAKKALWTAAAAVNGRNGSAFDPVSGRINGGA